jgi:hypothetical protein
MRTVWPLGGMEVPTGQAGRAVEVVDAQAGGRCADEDSDRQATHIHRGVAADWWSNRGASGTALGACSPRGGWVVAAARGGVAVVRVGGDTKTKKSRRTLALPERCIEALCRQRAQQAADRFVGRRTVARDRSGVHHVGRNQDARGQLRRDFRRALALVPGLNPSEWTPRKLRHSFVSLLFRCRRAAGEDLATGRTQRHNGHRIGVPAPAAAGDSDRCDRHGPAVQREP